MRDWQSALAGIVALRKRGANLVGHCPFHHEKTASFYVYADGHYHCYGGCGAHGWCDDLLGQKRVKSTRLPESPGIWPTLDWSILTANARQNDVARRLARWRGYSAKFCEWLIERGHVGAVEGQIAFPIRQDGRIVRAHVRRNEDIDCKARGLSPFFYFPTIGSSVDAMVIRRSGDQAHVFESQWDTFAALDQLRSGGLWIATRGASNARKLAVIDWPSVVHLWPQNDDAGEVWLRNTLAHIPKRCDVRVYRLPRQFKDVNEYTGAGEKLANVKP